MLGLWLEHQSLSLRHNLDKVMPPPGEALIQVLQAGICNTDLELVKGYYPYQGILGHEFVGIVVQGPDHLLNKRVVGEITATCGHCRTCKRGHNTHCEQRSTLGIINRNGAFAEYLSLPLENLFLVPKQVSNDEATFTEPLAAALEVQQQVFIQPNTKIAVLGAGKLGMLLAQTLKLRGCELIVATTNQKKISLLTQLQINSATPELLISKKQYFDIVIEATGNPHGLQQALQLVRPRGTIVVKSTYAEPLTLNTAPIVVNEITLIGSRCGPFAPALDLLAKKLIDVSSLIETRFPLNEALAAFEKAAQPHMLKVLLTMASDN